MFLTIAIVLFAFWLIGLVVFKLTKGLIHLVLLVAVVALVVHLVRAKPS